VHFRPETGNSTNTYIIGAGLQVMPKTNVGINFARNSGPNHPSIINLSAVYSFSKSTEVYAAFNHAKDGAFSSYSGSVDATASPATLSQTVSISNAFILGLRKGF
jgi:predicted porin